MKKRVARFVAVLFCVMSQTSFSATSNDYFPLKPGTIWQYQVEGQEGNITTRKVLEKKVLVGEVETSVVQYVNEKLRVYFSSDSDGIYLHREIFHNSGRNFNVIFDPPLKFADSTFVIGDFFHSEGNAITRVAGRTFYFRYTADVAVEAMENITINEVDYNNTIRVRMDLTLKPGYGLPDFTISSTQNFAEGIGIVKEVTTDSDGITLAEELVYTNANIYDLAIVSIAQPKRVTLSAAAPTKTTFLKVKLRNKGPFDETIENAAMLSDLVAITVDSFGACPAPSLVLREGKPQKPFPITIKPGKTLTVYYDVTFDCANDPDKNTPDFRFSARVDRTAIDDKTDTNPADDICPRDSTSLTDKGCGAKKPDHTLGGDVTTDVVVK